MSRWLARLRDEEKSTKTHFDGTDKTDETSSEGVLSVRQSGEYEKKLDDGVAPNVSDFFTSASFRDIAPSETQVSQNAAPEPDGDLPRCAASVEISSTATPVVPFTPRARPGITIRAPAIEVLATVYDAHLDMLIADAADRGEGAGRLSSIKRCGAVVPRGSEWIFTRGRA